MPFVTTPNPVAVSHPLSQQFITLARGMEFDANDPIVKAFPWAFEQPVERATAGPGERRPVGRPKGSRNKPKDAA